MEALLLVVGVLTGLILARLYRPDARAASDQGAGLRLACEAI
ncbi:MULTISPECIES: hypothetical protein [unclassified Lysobacter]|nr:MULTISPECIES: hypothetical protein [unclassified Lysobacter]